MNRKQKDLSVDSAKANGISEHKFQSGNSESKPKSPDNSGVVYQVFISLLLDLLAFTMILPLFPSILDHYRLNDSPDGLYPWLLKQIKLFQQLTGTPDRFSSVLFGGFLGSMFSLLQFLASPLIGGISDAYGRKPVMICCLIGIASSYVLWALSKNFAFFVVARIIGGISKGNVSLSLAIVADVSTPKTRGRGMALVGVAFSVGFIVGPVIGAAFAHWSHGQTGNWYVVPASFALGLAVMDVFYVTMFLKETLPKANRKKSVITSLNQAVAYINVIDLFQFRAVKEIQKKEELSLSEAQYEEIAKRIDHRAHVLKELYTVCCGNFVSIKPVMLPNQEESSDHLRGSWDSWVHNYQNSLRWLGYVYFIYLFLYSGMEFTLTFLTHHKFNYTSMQQGWMFFVIGLTMALMQGFYVRKLPEDKMASTTIWYTVE
ncbi:uncharacterized protein GBIM_13318 [Gryllus bimaculatus]|nr:uncharacterized protein GBIM_13318 [Gryllus bimaculatus]